MLNKIRLSDEEADQVDKILYKNGAGFLSVDRSMLDDCMEAWVYVKIIKEDQREEYIDKQDKEMENNEITIRSPFNFWGFDETKGVLTWNNSD